MKLMICSAAAFLTLTALPAAAQNFDGPSVGVQAGWEKTELTNPGLELGIVPFDASKDSATLGGYLGYDKEIGRAVIGGELGLQFGTSDTIGATAGVSAYRIDPRRAFDLSLRGGYLIGPKTLVYARGGYTNERVRTTISSGAVSTVRSEDRDGWLVGGGLERVIIPHVSARVEYRYADLSEGDGKFDRHQVLTGVTWRF